MLKLLSFANLIQFKVFHQRNDVEWLTNRHFLWHKIYILYAQFECMDLVFLYSDFVDCFEWGMRFIDVIFSSCFWRRKETIKTCWIDSPTCEGRASSPLAHQRSHNKTKRLTTFFNSRNDTEVFRFDCYALQFSIYSDEIELHRATPAKSFVDRGEREDKKWTHNKRPNKK